MDPNQLKLQSESFAGAHGSRPITLSPEAFIEQEKKRRIRVTEKDWQAPADLSEALLLVAKKMRVGPGFQLDPNEIISAGFTYVGQFIAHDLTYHKNTTGLNFPRLRLDALYGGGPAIHTFLYNQYGNDLGHQSDIFWNENLDNYKHSLFRMAKYGNLYDLKRLKRQVPLIADARNDQNFIISQLHVAFMRFHNAMAKYYHGLDSSLTADALFEKTKKSVIHHYQWMIVHQYLKQIVYDPELIDRLLQKDNQAFLLYDPSAAPELMEEFFAAAFRVGHSQVLNSYPVITRDGTTALKIFDYTYFNTEGAEPLDLRGFVKRKKTRLDWRRFFFWYQQENAQEKVAVTMAGKYDLKIADALGQLIFLKKDHNSLIARNLSKVPPRTYSAHRHAKALYKLLPNYVDRILSQEDVLKAVNIPELTESQQNALKPENLPLWLYLLLEASVLEEGNRLGPLGSHIIAEQFIWALKMDEQSCLCIDNGNWRPEPMFDAMKLELDPGTAPELPEGVWGEQNRLFSIQHLFKLVFDQTTGHFDIGH